MIREFVQHIKLNEQLAAFVPQLEALLREVHPDKPNLEVHIEVGADWKIMRYMLYVIGSQCAFCFDYWPFANEELDFLRIGDVRRQEQAELKLPPLSTVEVGVDDKLQATDKFQDVLQKLLDMEV